MSAPHPHDFDLFVIGGGSAGVRLARIAAGHGAKVGIAEERFWGGTCVNVGCVPKKIMVQAAEYGAWAKDAAAFGWGGLENPTHDWSVLARARDAEVARLSGIYGRLLGGVGVETFEARAHFTGPNTLQVGERIVTAARIVVAVGGTPIRPEIPGAEHAFVSDDLFTLKALPKRVLMVGGGYIGLEFASLLHGLGAEVTVVYRQALPLRGFDHEIREGIAEALAADGIAIRSGETPAAIERTGDTFVTRMASGALVEADAVFFAVGRKPATAGLGLDAAGINCREGTAIAVGDDHATNIPHIYAIGDVTDRVNLTPMATAVGHALADTLFGPRARTASYENVPKAVFTAPPIGSVGLTEEEAALRGPVEVYTARFTPMRHTITRREGRKTLMKLVVEAGTGCLLGAHMLGEEAPEIMQGLAVAVVNRLTKAQLDATIGIHPTAAEEFVTMRVATRRVGDAAARAA